MADINATSHEGRQFTTYGPIDVLWLDTERYGPGWYFLLSWMLPPKGPHDTSREATVAAQDYMDSK